MAKAAAIIITGIAIALLVIYGADVAAGMDNPDKQGFLDMDHKTRGYGLGGPAMALPLIAYFISRNDSSKGTWWNDTHCRHPNHNRWRYSNRDG